MTINTMADLEVTPANNVDLLSQSTSGSESVNKLDNMIRNLAAILARGYGDTGGTGIVGGSANAITLTSNSTYQALESGLQIAFKAGAANTGATTLNLDGLGVKKVRRRGDSALSAGDIAANGRYLLQYDAAYDTAAGAWVLMNPEIPANTYQPYDADLVAVADTGVSAFSGLLYGLTLSNNGTDATNDIDIAAGIAIDSTNAKFLKLASGLTKRLDAAWAVGTNQGGLDTGSIANTTYHMWLIMRSDTGVVDVLFSTSASSPTMPANYDYKRRIGSILRASAAITAFKQSGDQFTLGVPVNVVNSTNPGTSAVTVTAVAPLGITPLAILTIIVADSVASSANSVIVSALTQPDTAPTDTVFTFRLPNNTDTAGISSIYNVELNTSAQSRYRLQSSDAGIIVRINSLGWIDTRGRLG